MGSRSTEWVIFDLGGVLVELGGVHEFGGMIGERDPERVWERWLGCPIVRDYERGRCSTEAFASGMVERYDLEIEPDAFMRRFAGWPKGLFAGAGELVDALADRVGVACLSNTNALHWDHQTDADALKRLFPKKFLSYELGLVKPDDDIYTHVLAQLGCPASAVCFLDDNQINVDAARRHGIDAHRVVGIDAVRAFLEDNGWI